MMRTEVPNLTYYSGFSPKENEEKHEKLVSGTVSLPRSRNTVHTAAQIDNNLTVAQIFKKFSPRCGSRITIPVFTRDNHYSLIGAW
jgi:hypothetical protein